MLKLSQGDGREQRPMGSVGIQFGHMFRIEAHARVPCAGPQLLDQRVVVFLLSTGFKVAHRMGTCRAARQG
ncbi:hypothetical protein ACWENS_11130 [Streptomyces sp. NPDC004532]